MMDDPSGDSPKKYGNFSDFGQLTPAQLKEYYLDNGF